MSDSTEESESEIEYLSSIHTCYHRKFFLLRTPLSVCGKPVEIRLCNGSPMLTCHHSGQELSAALSSVSHKVAGVLRNHGVYHVDTFYYEQVPLFSVVFSSKSNLKRFLASSSAQVKSSLESTIGEEFTTKLGPSQPAKPASKFQPSHPKLTLNIELYLITPDRKEKGKAEVELVTLANYSHYSSQWQGSRMFEFTDVFKAHPHQDQCGNSKERVECAELKDLVIELQEVTQWFALGLQLDIPEAELMHIDYSHRLTKDRLMYMLIEWGKRENRTWSKVIRALNALGIELLARKLCTKYGTSVSLQQTDINATPLPEKAGIGVQAEETKIAEIKQAEKQLDSMEEQLKVANASRHSLKQGIIESMKNVQRLQVQLQTAITERKNIQDELNKKTDRCEGLHRMTVHYRNSGVKSKELMKDIPGIEIILKEKQEEVKQLQDEVKQKECDIQTKHLALSQLLQDVLSQKIIELEKETTKVLELEREVEKLKIEFKTKGQVYDMKLQEMIAKISSQNDYIKELQHHQETMKEEISVQQEKMADYQHSITEKEEKIRELSERLQQKLEEKQKIDVGASSTAEAKTVEVTRIRYDMLRMRVKLDEAKRERHQLAIKSDSLEQSIKQLKSMIPDLSKCRAIGIESGLKHQLCKFQVQVADTDGEPCTGNHAVTVQLVEDDVITQANVVSKTSATYEVSFQPHKSGQHKIDVKVNGKPIKDSPFPLFIDNLPHPQNCRVLGDGVKQAEKNKESTLMVEVADADNEPCVTEQVITASLRSLAGSVMKAGVVNKTTATYEVSYQPNKAGQHELYIAVNDKPIKNSPFALLVSNVPDPFNNCKVVGEGLKTAEKGTNTSFIVQLADADGEPCVTKQEIAVALKSMADGLVTEASAVQTTAATYKATYQPTKAGKHELIVKVNSISINGSPFKVFIFNVPHPQTCKAVGEGIQQAEKHKKSEFIVELADADGEPCITKQEVTVVLNSLADDSVVKVDVVSRTAAIYEASYQASKSGEHQLLVEVNGKHISGSPFPLLVSNTPHPHNCRALGDGVKQAEKNKESTFTVELADTDNEPCVTKQVITALLKSLTGSVIKAGVVSKTTATYEVSYRPNKAGQHELHVAVNDTPIKGSPFKVFVHNIPDPFNNCKAVGNGVKEAEKGINAKFIVHLADADGEPCVTEQKVAVALKSMADGSVTNARVVKMTAAAYEATYQPTKSGEHELIVKVNSTSIKGSPFKMFACNSPHFQNCKAVGEGIQQAEKHKISEFIIELADVDGEPCITKQEVTVVLIFRANISVAKVDVVSKTAALYKASYQPTKSGEYLLLIKVNGKSISGSPFPLLVSNIPHPPNCKTLGDGVKQAEKNKESKFMVELADADNEPCVTKQVITASLKSLTGSVINAVVVSKTTATYEVSYRPNKAGQHELHVAVNDMPIKGSPFELLVHNIPDPFNNCKAVGEGLKTAEKCINASFIVQLADADGEPCVTKQEVAVALKSMADGLISKASVVQTTAATYKATYQPTKAGKHKLIVKVNSIMIKGSPFQLLAYNIPHPQNCKVVAGAKQARKNNNMMFMIQLADGDGESCVTEQEVTVVLKSMADGLVTSGIVMKKTAAKYKAIYQPIKSGAHEIHVKVNSMPIKGSPFPLFVYNTSHPQNCKVLGDGVKRAEKNKEAKFIVEVADTDNEPCVTKQVVTASLKSLTGSVIKAGVVSKTTATYEVSYQPTKAGQHELHVAVNDMPINSSPFALLVSNVPDPFNNCKVVGEGVKTAEKGINTSFIVQLADADGEPCVTKQEVAVALKSMADELVTQASVVKKTSATYEAIYQPTKCGEHKLIVKVNSISINGSPFKVFIFNVPHPQTCKAVGEGIQQAEKHKKSKFIVQLADADGEPCITKQEVTVVLIFLANNSVTKVDVVSKTAALYEASYQPTKSGEHQLLVKVNGKSISGSPFPLLVSTIPHPQNCKVVGNGIKRAEKNMETKFIVQLADVDGEPCVTKQQVTVQLKSLADGLATHVRVVSKTAAIYETSYRPGKIGEHQFLVKVNGTPIKGSPSLLFVYNSPRPQNCKTVGDGIKRAEKNKRAKFIIQLANVDGEPCITKQEVTVVLIFLANISVAKVDVVSKTAALYKASYQPTKSGEHLLLIKVNGKSISGSPFPLLVSNIPHPPNCKTLGDGVKQAEKNKESKFMVELADADNEPCVTKQVITASLKSLTGSVINAVVVSKTAATYEVSYRPNKAGQHELHVAVNDMAIKGSPFELLVSNVPDPFNNCKAVGNGVKEAGKGINSMFIVQLADADGEPCVTEQKVAVALKSMADGSVSNARVVKMTAAVYEATYQPTKGGEHELIVKVNSTSIKGSPFKMLVSNSPHPQNCKAVGDGIKQAEKNRKTKFIVQLADVDGEPCVTEQQVTVQVKSLADGSVVEGCIVNKTMDTYEATYQPNKSGQHEIIVKVNGTPITSSPFSLCVNNFLPLLMKSMSEHISCGPPAIYRLCPRGQDVLRDSRAMVAKCIIGKPVDPPPAEKVLMVVGASGAGKSTLINGMVNYIFGVEWRDEFRFKLIVDEESQAKGHMKQTTVYTFHKMEGSPIPYTLKVIDTPGFGNYEQDEEITRQIESVGIDHLDGIGFVIPSWWAHLTRKQMYIFDYILSGFGKDVAKKIFMFCTFADGKQPPVISEIKKVGIPYSKFYKFNSTAFYASCKARGSTDELFWDMSFNSTAFYASYKARGSTDELFWDMSYMSFDNFFTDFHSTDSISFQLTREVLYARQKLKDIVRSLQLLINQALGKIEEMQEEEITVQQLEAEIAANRTSTYRVDIVRIRKIPNPRGIFTIYCVRYNYTCLSNSPHDDEHKYKSSNFNGNGYCLVCPDKCHWKQHLANPYKIEVYKNATEAKKGAERMLAQLELDLKRMHTELLKLIQFAQQNLDHSDEIALRKYPFREDEYIDLLIESEKQEASPGWQGQVQYLKSTREHAALVKTIKKFDRTIQEYKTGSKSWFERFAKFRV